MQRMNREDAMDLLRRGVRRAADTPGRTVTVEFTKLSIFVELELDEGDRRDPVFLDTMAELAFDDLERKLEGRMPRFVNIYTYGGLILRD